MYIWIIKSHQCTPIMCQKIWLWFRRFKYVASSYSFSTVTWLADIMYYITESICRNATKIVWTLSAIVMIIVFYMPGLYMPVKNWNKWDKYKIIIFTYLISSCFRCFFFYNKRPCCVSAIIIWNVSACLISAAFMSVTYVLAVSTIFNYNAFGISNYNIFCYISWHHVMLNVALFSVEILSAYVHTRDTQTILFMLTTSIVF